MLQLKQQNLNKIDQQASKLAREFLNVEGSIEDQHYLVETTIPTVVTALESLLEEMTSKDIPLDATKFLLTCPDPIQTDKPFQRFDAINWFGIRLLILAQSLIRNNPKYHASKSKYSSEMKLVADLLKDKINGIGQVLEVRIDNSVKDKIE